jgi:hypothetical protein
MSTRRLLAVLTVVLLVVSEPFMLVHLMAAPDDAPITPLQHVVAALANFFGPWGVAIVRLVDFPNAGLRSFSWVLAVGLTLVGTGLLVLLLKSTRRGWQIALTVVWGLFLIIWFGVGLRQIADGLL